MGERLTYKKLCTKLDRLEKQKRQIKEKYNKTKYSVALAYRMENKRKFLYIDLLIVAAILFNISAMLITNALVVVDNPDKKFEEANPIQCKINKYLCTKEIVSGYYFLFKQVLLYGLLVYGYVVLRNKIVSHCEYNYLFACFLFLSVSMCFDFVNDFGYYIGTLLI